MRQVLKCGANYNSGNEARVRNLRLSQPCWWRFKSSGTCTLSSGLVMSGPRIWRQQALPKYRWLFTNRHGSPWRSKLLRMNVCAVPGTRNSLVTDRLRSQVEDWTRPPMLAIVCVCGTWWHIIRVAACWFETAGGGRENSWSQSVPRSPAQWTSLSSPLSEAPSSWYPGLFNFVACQNTASLCKQVVYCCITLICIVVLKLLLG